MYRLILTVMMFATYAFPARAQYDFSSVDNKLEQYQQKLGGNSCTLIWKDGKIIYSKAQGDYTADTELPVASCSKWLTAALIMTFVDEGKISLDDTVGKWLPVFTRYGKGNITIRNCLSHTTGFESEPLTVPGIMKIYTHRRSMHSLNDETDEFATTLKLIARPGTEFRYSGIGLNIAGRIAEIAGGKDFNSLFLERIAGPLDMTHSRFMTQRSPADPSGGAISTANDYMHFLLMILNKGVYQGRRILSEESVNRMQQTQITMDMIKYAPAGAAKGYLYGLGEWVLNPDAKGQGQVVASPGLFGTWPMVDNCHHYACIFVIKKILGGSQREIYMDIKKEIDKQMGACN